ncbi:unnamed protein product [Bursaphelenchus okinawaensis]|uniref:Fibronectin type-III domain-containing protein n=1 Tax=Bursaphelenchus okinawaensis TaxID=465554 RepID=A0A811L3V2_9BILA|nr:unnamed protein product [Bursaphelenchus okinawaensis]CAG9115590.1 unnamed protein product [Bursaphelenchus okinawaensis]
MPPAGSTGRNGTNRPTSSRQAPAPSDNWPVSHPMEPIPEEQESAATSPTRVHQPSTSTLMLEDKSHMNEGNRSVTQVQRKKEVYTSEQVDTLVSTLPEDIVPEDWRNFSSEEVVNDPIMAHTYVTHLPGQMSARSSRTTYIYEAHLDDPNDMKNSFSEHDDSLERHSTQKVTRVTKVTTTRSIKQIPVDPSDIYFDSEGNPRSNGYDGTLIESDEGVGIDLSRASITETSEENSEPVRVDGSSGQSGAGDGNKGYVGTVEGAKGLNGTYNDSARSQDSRHYQEPYQHTKQQQEPSQHAQTYHEQYQTTEIKTHPTSTATPDAPERPEVMLTVDNDLLLSWKPPRNHGSAGEVIGYLVEFRRNEKDDWEPAHDELLVDTDCRVSKLEDLDYQFRVTAANPAGFGAPSLSSLLTSAPRRDSQPVLLAPSSPKVIFVGQDKVILECDPLLHNNPRFIGTTVEYRPVTSSIVDWIVANDYPSLQLKHEVVGLRPTGEYEFRAIALYDDNSRVPSVPVGPILLNGDYGLNYGIPQDYDKTPEYGKIDSVNGQVDVNLPSPGRPEVQQADLTWVQLHWTPPVNAGTLGPFVYLVEVRDISSTDWFIVGPEPIATNEFIADNLHRDFSYEFRVSIMLENGTRSLPGPVSNVISLSQLMEYAEVGRGVASVPERPAPPEYLDFDGGNSVTLCWLPAKSTLPVTGYDVEFRDIMQDSAWYKVTDALIRSCKTTVGYLIYGHQYQFRILAKNSHGFSEPSDPSPLITIGSLTKDTKYLEAERHGAISLLQDEMIRESPPLPDRDDSPPPMYKQPNSGNLQWRDPTLKEVIEYLKSNDEEVVKDASGYLQHLTYHNELIKEDTRQYGGIPLLVKLLSHSNPEIVRNCCGSLKNLCHGKNNDVNKNAINADGGIKALGQVLKTTSSVHVREEATGALWNISSCDDLKEPVFHQVADLVVSYVVVPASGIMQNQAPEHGKHGTASVFRNGTGILRNVSAASAEIRKLLRVVPGLIEALLFSLKASLDRQQVDTQAVENTVSLLRNLSYRVQEVVDPKYDPRLQTPRSSRERSKSAPNMSPKTKRKGLFKKSKKDDIAQNGGITGPPLLWHSSTVEIYLRLLQEASKPEILEASAAAIQNLAACAFEGSVQTRMTVRTLKGLPILVELLKLREDKVVCAVMTALRNLCIDQKNLELIIKYGLRDLLTKLPSPGQETRNDLVSDGTIGAVLGILWEAARGSLEMTRTIHEHGGTDRLRTLAKSYPIYGKRVCKYATQVLFLMWQHRELQDGFKRSGLKDADFYAGTIQRRGRSAAPSSDVATLRRPISSQGNERPAHLKSADETIDSARYEYEALTPTGRRTSSARYAEYSPYNDRSASARLDGDEALYSAVQKKKIDSARRGSVGGDSWV